MSGLVFFQVRWISNELFLFTYCILMFNALWTSDTMCHVFDSIYNDLFIFSLSWTYHKGCCFLSYEQVISFIDIFLRYSDAHTVLCIVPINTLQNWVSEFNMWIPKEEDISKDNADEVFARSFPVFVVNDNHKTTHARASVIGECLLTSWWGEVPSYICSTKKSKQYLLIDIKANNDDHAV